jgi:hypothetical protein
LFFVLSLALQNRISSFLLHSLIPPPSLPALSLDQLLERCCSVSFVLASSAASSLSSILPQASRLSLLPLPTFLDLAQMAPLVDAPTSTTEQQWYYTRAELDRSPSVQAGMSLREEREMRQKAVHAVWQLKDGVDLYVHFICITSG